MRIERLGPDDIDRVAAAEALFDDAIVAETSRAFLAEDRMFDGEFGRIRDINVAPDGALWLLTDERDGAIIRVSRTD